MSSLHSKVAVFSVSPGIFIETISQKLVILPRPKFDAGFGYHKLIEEAQKSAMPIEDLNRIAGDIFQVSHAIWHRSQALLILTLGCLAPLPRPGLAL